MTEEKGKRVERAPDENIRDRRRPKGVDVLKEIGDRVIIQFNNQTIVESNDGPRMNRGAKDVYYEDLPRGRTRETVVRDNGIQIVTIRNRNGDVIQRSRITPDGREYVLSYVDEQHYEDDDDWRDPGDDLPPMRLTIPRRRVHSRFRGRRKTRTTTTPSSNSRRWRRSSASIRSTRSSVRPACATLLAASTSTR